MKVVLLHGKDTDPSQKWYPWFIKEVRSLSTECVAPVLPHPGDPILSDWLDEITATHPDDQTILVGHSRGGVAILRWLEKLAPGKKVYAVILIATNSGYTEKVSASENSTTFFSERGYDFEKIKTHCDTFIVFHSRDDATVPFEAGGENAKGLEAKFLEFDGRGHFGRTVKDIPELIEEIKKLKSEFDSINTL